MSVRLLLRRALIAAAFACVSTSSPAGLAAAFGAAGASEPTGSAAPDPGGPVVLELFTAQGCSSCPPADRVLSRLGLGVTTRARVVPLAFHVDYWNPVGWTDPFGAAEWSERQGRYSRAFGVDGMYTPQLVVNGSAELNGARELEALARIAEELKRPRAASVSLTAREERGGRPALAVDVAAEVHERIEDADKLQLFVAVFENGLITPVARGENHGRTLENDFVVRRLEKAVSLEPKPGARAHKSLTLKLDAEWKLENTGVAAFLQDPRSMRIHAAAARPVR